MKSKLSLVAGVLLGLALGIVGVSYAVAPVGAKYADAKMVAPAPMAPGVPVIAAGIAAGSASNVTLTTPGVCVRLTCSSSAGVTSPCTYRVCSGGCTTGSAAVATDNDLPSVPEGFCLLPNQDSIGVFNSGSVTITEKVSVRAGPTQ